jgi:hypothetical protein
MRISIHLFFLSREKDMNDLLFMLTATLKLAPVTVTNVQDSDLDPNELTNSSNDSDKTVVYNGDVHSPSEEQSNIYTDSLNENKWFFF